MDSQTKTDTASQSTHDACDHRVREVTQLRLAIRSDLRFTPHYESGERCYLIEDPARSQFYRVGISEYLFISMLDSATTVGDALIRLAAVDPHHALTEGEATAICKWLVDSALASTPESNDSSRLAGVARDRSARKRLGTLNPLCAKVPLAYPDQLFARVTPWLSPLFGRVAGIVTCLLLIVGVFRISVQWDHFSQASGGIFSPGRWAWLLVCWLVLKVIHESAHAIVCRKYGGAVHEAGAIFVLFAPLAYVDLTSSWRFRSKWQRIHTAAAGMYIELAIAALAAIAWTVTDAGLVNDLCFNVVVMASLTTLLFNANPLMRFDGYYILSDSLEIANLYGEGQQYLQYLGRRYILGEKIHSSLRWTPREVFTRIYGIASLLWRIVICISLVLAASMMFDGFGILLALAAVIMWIGVPAVGMLKYVCKPDGLQRRRQARLLVASIATLFVGYIAMDLRWPGATRASVVVEYEDLTFVRATSAGFVRQINVQSGDTVVEGQPIAILENLELVAELEDLNLSIKQSQLKCRVYKQNDEIHSYQAEKEQLLSLRTKQFEKSQQVDQLTLRASSPGRVIARNLSLRIGDYLEIGDELAAVGDENAKELRLAIDQGDYDQFKSHVGENVKVRISGGAVLTSTLKQVEPRATKQAPHESMYASLGGQLPCRSVDSDQAVGQFELLSKHFTGVVELDPTAGNKLRVGQRGVVWFGRSQKTIGSMVSERVRKAIPKSLAGFIGQVILLR
jgi:putative peptide zinc metalloprotease protein